MSYFNQPAPSLLTDPAEGDHGETCSADLCVPGDFCCDACPHIADYTCAGCGEITERNPDRTVSDVEIYCTRCWFRLELLTGSLLAEAMGVGA